MQSLATRYDVLRHRLADGEETTVYVVGYPRPQTSLSVEHFAAPQQLDHWCRRSGVQEAIVGGFFVRPQGPPLGELWIGGRRIETEPILHPYGGARAAISIDEGEIHIGPRAELPPRPVGHLLQAGPMLVRDGAPLRDLHDPEGSVAGVHQFDSDITSGRHPRAALGTSDDELIALVCDGRRTGIDVGLTLAELAEFMADLGARQASTSTVAAPPHSSTTAISSTDPTTPKTDRAATPARSRQPRSSTPPEHSPHSAELRSDHSRTHRARARRPGSRAHRRSAGCAVAIAISTSTKARVARAPRALRQVALGPLEPPAPSLGRGGWCSADRCGRG